MADDKINAPVPRRGYTRIYRRLLAVLLLLALTPPAALALFCVDRINVLYSEKISAGLEAVTSSKHRALDTFFTERTAQIKNLAFMHSYAELREPLRLSEIFSIMQANSRSFVDLGIIEIDGKHAAYVGPYDLYEADYSETPWFREVLRKGVYVSDVFTGYRQVPHIIIAVLRHEGGRSFIMRATVDMDAVAALLRRVYSGPRSDAFLVNREGILQTDSREHGKAMAGVPFALPDMARGGMHTLPLPTAGGQVQAAVMPLESMPWDLVVVDDAAQSLQLLHRLKMQILLFVLLGCLTAGAGAVFFTRRLVTSMEERDREQAHIDARMLQSSKMAALGKMAAGVAHEINNPLMLIQENAGWIRDLLGDENPAEMKNYAEIRESAAKIEQHTARAKGITQRMLGFGRRMNPGRSEVMLNALADQALAMLGSEAASRNIGIVRHYDAQLPVILSDPAQLEQVFINIIDNAVDAVGKNGSLTVTTEALESCVRVCFTDSGPGMDQETAQRIFDPFFTTKAVGEGTGLGLAICYGILDKLGGRIEVRSALGQGTTFCITLPPEPADAAGLTAAASEGNKGV